MPPNSAVNTSRAIYFKIKVVFHPIDGDSALSRASLQDIDNVYDLPMGEDLNLEDTSMIVYATNTAGRSYPVACGVIKKQ